MATDMVAVRDIELSVTEAGEGRPVLLLHGFPELAYSWRHQIPALAAAGIRPIAYDMRGCGESAKPEAIEDYRLTELVGDVIGLADALGIEEFDLVGHDWGSLVGFSVAVMHPQRIGRLVSLNVPYRGWCSGFPTIAFIEEHLAKRYSYVLSFQEPGVTEAAFADDPIAWLKYFYDGASLDSEFHTDQEFSIYVDAFKRGGVMGPVNYYRNIDRNAEDTSHLADAEITLPTLMVTTDSDPVLPARLAEGMDRWVPDLRVEHIESCGHWTQQEQPEATSNMLIDFLAGSR